MALIVEPSDGITAGSFREGTMEKLDVLIVGAGLSGIGAACVLTRECPGQRLAVLEARAAG